MSEDYKSCKDNETGGKHGFWQTHIELWGQSGISQSEYCRRHALNVKVFGYWKRKSCRKSSNLSFVPVAIKSPFPLSVKSGASLKLVTGNGYGIEIGDGFNPATLRVLLDTLGQRV